MKDLFYWGGLIAGMGIGHLGLAQLGVHNRILQLLAGLALGVGLGYMLERMYTSGQLPRDDYPH